VAAVEEGRGIYDNIAKTLGYLLAGNAGELMLVLAAVVVGWPLPLLPIQLLWINLVTDGLPALALATDPIDRTVLARPPRPPQAGLLNLRFLARTVLIGALTAAVALVAFVWELESGADAATARNAAFSVLVTAELLRALGARSDIRTVFELGVFTNLRLFLVVSVSFALQLLIHHVPVLESLFGTEPVSLLECLYWIALGAVPAAILEGAKLVGRGTNPSPRAVAA
jgi:P-type Ca2+ transporter type 2C